MAAIKYNFIHVWYIRLILDYEAFAEIFIYCYVMLDIVNKIKDFNAVSIEKSSALEMPQFLWFNLTLKIV